jgi:hypothetical protein
LLLREAVQRAENKSAPFRSGTFVEIASQKQDRVWLPLRLEQFTVIAEDLKSCFASA